MTNATLYKHMAQVLAEVKAIPKTGRNQFFKYDYMTADDIMTHLRDLLSKNGIAVFARMDGDPISIEAGNTKGGQPRYRVVAKFVFTLACAETGAAIECPWYGEAIDEQDKAINKAATAAMKYWLMKTFLLTTGDEEQDTEFDGHHKTTPQSRQNGAARPAPAPAATITSAAPQSAAEPQLELVGLYGLTPEQMDAPATAQSIWEAVYENLTAFKFNARPHAKNAVAPMMSDLIGKPLREALEIIRTRKTHQGEIA